MHLVIFDYKESSGSIQPVDRTRCICHTLEKYGTNQEHMRQTFEHCYVKLDVRMCGIHIVEMSTTRCALLLKSLTNCWRWCRGNAGFRRGEASRGSTLARRGVINWGPSTVNKLTTQVGEDSLRDSGRGFTLLYKTRIAQCECLPPDPVITSV